MPKLQDGAIELNRLLESSFIAGATGGQPQDQAEKGAWEVAEVMGWKTEKGWKTQEEKAAAKEEEVQETPSFIVARIRKADEFVPGTFMAEDVDTPKGIRAVRGRLKNTGKPGTLSLYFLRSKDWNKDNVLKYINYNQGE